MKRFGQWHIIQGIVLSFVFSLTGCKMIGFSVSTDDATDPNFKVAFIRQRFSQCRSADQKTRSAYGLGPG